MLPHRISTPLILFIGQVGRDMRDREAFQEVDYKQLFGGIAKWVAEIDDPARVPEYVARAFNIAMSGRPGPVVLSLPEDMLRESADVSAIPTVHPAENGTRPARHGRFGDTPRHGQKPDRNSRRIPLVATGGLPLYRLCGTV